VLPGLDPIHKISIVQRGFGALRLYVCKLPLEDSTFGRGAISFSQLAVLLGGRTAEEIALSEISTAGAKRPAGRATDIARAMVTNSVMSDALGAINYEARSADVFSTCSSRRSAASTGEQTAEKIDAEIKRNPDRRAPESPRHPLEPPREAGIVTRRPPGGRGDEGTNCVN